MSVAPGEKFSFKFTTSSEHSAKHVGSGDVDVLSTPSMILFMEEACRRYMDDRLPESETTVGTRVDIYHVKAAPVGSEIEVHGTLLAIEGRKLVFWVEVWHNGRRIGYGVHERYIVNREAFLRKLKGEKNG